MTVLDTGSIVEGKLAKYHHLDILVDSASSQHTAFTVSYTVQFILICSWSFAGKLSKKQSANGGQLDILVNNASFQGKSVENFEDIDRERLEFTFHSNILNYFSTSQAAVKHMKEGSAIINIGSIQGYNPSPGVLDYSCTKASLPFCKVPSG